jgi:carboxyl-terminal processing protease
MNGKSALKVTVARWLTPDGVSISDGGLKPDIVISRTVEERKNNKDSQREAALKFLRGEEVKSETEPE